jgi:hypothetical protein
VPNRATCRRALQADLGTGGFLCIQKNNFGFWRFTRYQMLDLGSRQAEGCSICHDNIGHQFTDFSQTLRGVGGFANHSDIGLILQQTPQTLAEQDMVVREDAADFPAGENDFS